MGGTMFHISLAGVFLFLPAWIGRFGEGIRGVGAYSGSLSDIHTGNVSQLLQAWFCKTG